jgi:SAM-dependent methyltransferase
MHIDCRNDAQIETLNEIIQSKKLYNDTPGLQKYWDELFAKQYINILESPAEIGRHGVIAEIINRFASEGSILDVGCGTGILSQLINYNKFKYEGCDISDVAIEYSVKNRYNVKAKFVRCRIEDIQYTNKLSAIVFNESLYYLDVDEAFDKSNKLLKNGGFFIASVFDFPEGEILLKSLRNRLEVKSETIVLSKEAGFKWNIIAGHIKNATKTTDLIHMGI